MSVPRLRATEADGRTVDDPSRSELFALLAGMGPRKPFVVVERLDREPAGQHFMQVHLVDGYQVEYREGDRRRHFKAFVDQPHSKAGPGPEFLVTLFTDWANDGPVWRDALPWERLRLRS